MTCRLCSNLKYKFLNNLSIWNTWIWNNTFSHFWVWCLYQVATSSSLESIYFIQMPFATSVSLVFITNALSQRQLLNLLLTFFQYTCILFNLDMRVFHIFLSKECMNIIRVIISYVSDRYVDPTVFTFFRIPLCQRKNQVEKNVFVN